MILPYQRFSRLNCKFCNKQLDINELRNLSPYDRHSLCKKHIKFRFIHKYNSIILKKNIKKFKKNERSR